MAFKGQGAGWISRLRSLAVPLRFRGQTLRLQDIAATQSEQGFHPFVIESIPAAPSSVLLGVFIGKPQSTGDRLKTLHSWRKASPMEFKQTNECFGRIVT